MCPTPKREVDVKLTYQGITLGYIHFECMKNVIKNDVASHMRDEDGYNIWSLPKIQADGKTKIKYTEPCLNSFHVDPPEEAGV